LLQRSSAQSQVSKLTFPNLKRNNILALVSRIIAGSCYSYLFKGFLHDESHSGYWLSLSNPMNPIKCLLFKGRIPLWLHDVGPAGRSQCQPGLVSARILASICSYPTPPHVMDMRKTRMVGSLLKLCTASARFSAGSVPSIRVKLMW
jgi:hypothetical protein